MNTWLHRGVALLAAAALAASLTAHATEARRASGGNPYDDSLAAVIAQFGQAQTAPEQAVLLHRAARLRDYLDDRAALGAFFERTAADAAKPPLVRDRALRHLAEIELHRGDVDAAQSRYRQLGFVRDWMLVGAFPSSAGLEASFGPEHGLTRGESFALPGGQTVGWRTALPPGPRIFIDLSDYYPHAGSAVAFAATSVYAPQPERVALRFSVESAFKLWVNGTEVASGGAVDGVAFDQHSAGVELRAGWNSILFKLARSGEAAWRFALRVTAPEGGGLALPASAAQEFAAAGGEPRPVPVADLVDIARAAASETLAAQSAASRLFLLGEVELLHATGTPLEDMETAVRREPTAERWLSLARAGGDEGYRFMALNAALRADPHAGQARSELAAYYYGRAQLEKARDLLREALRDTPGDFVARKRYADVLAAADLRAAALSQYESIERDFPAPLWVKRALAPRYEGFGLLDRARALAAAALADNFDGNEERAVLTRLLERAGDAAGLERLYREAATLDPSYTVPLQRLAAVQAGDGRAAEAAATLRQALAIAPASDELHRDLGEVLLAAQRQDEARAAFDRAAALNPQHAPLRARLGRSTAPEDADAEYLVDPAALAASLRQQQPPEPAAAIALADIRVDRMFPSGLASSRVQQVYWIGSEAGAHQFATRSLQYAPGTHSFELLHARIHKPDGRVIEGEDGGESAVADPAISMYYDVRARLLRFRNLEKGDVVEIDYRLAPATKVNPYGDYFGALTVFRAELPQRLKRWVLVAPASRALSVAEERMPAAAVELRGQERIYRWEARDVAAMPSEPRGPAVTEIAPYVHVSTFSSWEELGRWYARLIAPQFALDASLREALEKLLAGKHTDAEKIRAIHHFVLRNTHYVALEFGIFGYKPYPVSQTYARRYGDCKDKASLMIALLRAAGIPAEIALVRTRSMGDLSDRAASIAVFNHAIVYLPESETWLDGTAEYAGAQELPIEDQGAMALTVGPAGRAALRRIAVSSPLDNFSRRVVTAQVGSDGVIRFSGSVTTRGEDAPGLRRSYELPERRRDAFATRLAEVLPAVHVEDVNVDGANDLEHDVTVKFRGRLDSLRGKTALSLPTTWMPHAWVQTLAPLAARTVELRLAAPWTAEEQIRFELPSGARVTALPGDRTLQNEFGSATLRFQQHGREVVVDTAVQFRKLRIAPEEYGAFRDFCDEVERALRAEIKVALGG